MSDESSAQELLPSPHVKEIRPNLWIVAAAGVAYGLAMRMLFGLHYFRGGADSSSAGSSGPMLVSFLFLVPALIGAYTLYLMPREQRNFGRALLAPWLPTLVFIGATAVLLIEGSICIAMALPIFLVSASLGGILAWAALSVVTPSRSTVGTFLLLPLIGGAFERGMPLPDLIGQSEDSIHIAAPPQAIWHLINDATDIHPDEMAQGVAWRIGVPYPIEAVTVGSGANRVRKLRWDKDVHFDEPIVDWDENRYIRWRYVFAADSIPDGALDEHVLIGGRHFDLLDTSYRLTPEEGGTRLSIHVSYRVSTHFNGYAGTWARWLVGDASHTILAFYQRRAEAAQTAQALASR